MSVTTVGALAMMPAHAGLYSNVHPVNIRTNPAYIGFQITEAFQNPANCGDVGFYSVPTAYDSKAVLAVLLTANVSGRTVSIVISNTLCDPINNRPVVTDVVLDN